MKTKQINKQIIALLLVLGVQIVQAAVEGNSFVQRRSETRRVHFFDEPQVTTEFNEKPIQVSEAGLEITSSQEDDFSIAQAASEKREQQSGSFHGAESYPAEIKRLAQELIDVPDGNELEKRIRLEELRLNVLNIKIAGLKESCGADVSISSWDLEKAQYEKTLENLRGQIATRDGHGASSSGNSSSTTPTAPSTTSPLLSYTKWSLGAGLIGAGLYAAKNLIQGNTVEAKPLLLAVGCAAVVGGGLKYIANRFFLKSFF